MAKEQTPSGAGDNGSGAAPDKNQNIEDQNKNKDIPKTVSWDNHKRALDDMHKYKQRAKDAELKLGENEESRLRDQEKWKDLAERKEAEAKEWKQKAEDVDDLFVNTQKYNAVKRYAVENGILTEAVDDLDTQDLNDVTVERTDSGRYAVSGAKEFVERLKQRRPFWFKKDKAPRINSGGGAPPDKPKELTPNDVVQAERDWKAGKIPQSKYQDIYQQYTSQRNQLPQKGI